MSDIRIATDFPDHPKVVRLGRVWGSSAIICLIRLWCFARKNNPDGNLSNRDDEDIEIAAGWDGESGDFVKAIRMKRTLFLDADNLLHDWEEHQSWSMGSQARSEKARKAAQKRWGDAPSNAMSMQQGCKEDAKGNAPILSSPTLTTPKTKTSTPKASPPEAIELARRLGRWIRERDPGNKSLAEGKHEKTFTTWADAIDKLNRIDGREWATIEAVIDWCQKDDFWQNNILSGAKLRGKFSTLFLKMSQENPSPPQGGDYEDGF